MYWNCSARRFCLPQIWLLEGPQGGLKNFLGSLSLAIFYFSLINYDIIRRLPQTPYGLGREGCPLAPIPHPSRRLRHLDPRRLRCLELGTPHFSYQITPLAGPQLNPALCHSITSYLMRHTCVSNLLRILHSGGLGKWQDNSGWKLNKHIMAYAK